MIDLEQLTGARRLDVPQRTAAIIARELEAYQAAKARLDLACELALVGVAGGEELRILGVDVEARQLVVRGLAAPDPGATGT